MKVSVNNSDQELVGITQLGDLLTQLTIPEKGIAVAVNNKVIKKKEWEQVSLKEGDAITIIRATQGG